MRTIEWADDCVRLIDQTRLPNEETVLECGAPEELAAAIREMRIRGAPALGVAGAMGLALAGVRSAAGTRDDLLAELERTAELLRSTRPTAVNLFWGVERALTAARRGQSVEAIRHELVAEARAMADEDEAVNRALGAAGAALLPEQGSVLTHCNAGALATVAYGTALGVVRAAWEQGKRIHVYVDETRPLLQGARLTAWELLKEGIPATLIADTMAGSFLRQGRIACVVVGADRIAANGDVANKIGTYQLAVLAKENGVPFYVAAPTSTVDLAVAHGDAIPIEERRADEVTHLRGVRVAPAGIAVANPAFDVTPHRYVTAIITERGVLRPPYAEALRWAVDGGRTDDG